MSTLESKTFGLMVVFLQATHRAAETAMHDTSLTPAQFFILKLLRAKPELTQVDLSAALGVTPGNVSQLIAKLEAAGLVSRAGQGRAKLVTLTSTGERLVIRLEPQHEKFLRGRFAALQEPERRRLFAQMEKLASPPRPRTAGR